MKLSDMKTHASLEKSPMRLLDKCRLLGKCRLALAYIAHDRYKSSAIVDESSNIAELQPAHHACAEALAGSETDRSSSKWFREGRVLHRRSPDSASYLWLFVGRRRPDQREQLHVCCVGHNRMQMQIRDLG